MAHDETADDGARSLLGRALLWTAALVAILVFLAARTNSDIIESRPDFAMSMYFALKQDIPTALPLLVLALLAWRFSPREAGTGAASLRLKGWQAWAVLIAPAILAFVLRRFALPDYDMTRDEQMVTFDAAIYAKGLLFEPIPAFWRNHYHALNTLFILPIGLNEGWVSGYLPVNAALRALLTRVLPADLVSPLLLFVATLSLWRIALRLWPDSPSTRAVVLLLFVTSSQVIFTATTVYAMTGHLALNCLWLALFLRATPLSHAGAIAVGFLATGLHQPLFHPLFVGPFLMILLRERRWKELAAYVAAYAAIGLFWLGWQPWVAAHGVGPVPVSGNDGVDYLERFRRGRTPFSAYSFYVMAGNLLRFVTWNHLLLLPLAGIGIWVHRADRFVQALWLGMAVVVVFMTLILPAQVNGWGYRYLHGFLGEAVLLAGYGWHALEKAGASPVRTFRLATAVGVLVLLPLHYWLAREQVSAFADATSRVRSIDADMVVVDSDVPFSSDLVSNRADLSNRPILLQKINLTPAAIPVLCARGSIAFAGAPMLGSISRYFRIPVPTQASPGMIALRDAAVAAGCRIVTPVAPPG